MSKNFRILMVVAGLGRNGGMENQAINLANHFIDKDVNVQFITMLPPLANSLSPKAQVKVIPIAYKLHNRIGALIYYFLLTIELLRLRKGFDIIHVHSMDFEALLVSVLLKIGLIHKPLIVKVASAGIKGDIQRFQKRWPKSFLQMIFDQTRCFIALTAEVREELISFGGKASQIVRIPNGVNTELFKIFSADKENLRIQLSLPKSDTLVIFVGRLIPKKRAGFLLTAWQNVVQRCEDATLLLLGDGVLRKKLENKVRELGLSSSVIFLGQKSHPVKYLQACDCFVLPSISEGMSNALLEAMACGLPVITTDTPGTRSIVEHGKTGLLFPEENPDSLSEILCDLIHNKFIQKRLGSAARDSIMNGYSMEIISECYMDLYSKLIKFHK